MKIVLTNQGDNRELIVESDLIRLIEPSLNGVGSHIVFDADMGRAVNETPAAIAAVIGASPVAIVPASMSVHDILAQNEAAKPKSKKR